MTQTERAIDRIEEAEMADGLALYAERQMHWSFDTFGPGRRTEGLLRHIAKELEEIRKDPLDVKEWVDVIILAFDGAWRAGHSPGKLACALVAKQKENAAREWPKPTSEDEPCEHVRGAPVDIPTTPAKG